MTFAVVALLLHDDELIVIRSSWIHKDNSNFCYYPPKAKKNYNNLLKSNAQPQKDWVLEKIRIFTDSILTYEEAQNKCRHYQFTSHSEVSENEEPAKRQKSLPARYQVDDAVPAPPKSKKKTSASTPKKTKNTPLSLQNLPAYPCPPSKTVSFRPLTSTPHFDHFPLSVPASPIVALSPNLLSNPNLPTHSLFGNNSHGSTSNRQMPPQLLKKSIKRAFTVPKSSSSGLFPSATASTSKCVKANSIKVHTNAPCLQKPAKTTNKATTGSKVSVLESALSTLPHSISQSNSQYLDGHTNRNNPFSESLTFFSGASASLLPDSNTYFPGAEDLNQHSSVDSVLSARPEQVNTDSSDDETIYEAFSDAQSLLRQDGVLSPNQRNHERDLPGGNQEVSSPDLFSQQLEGVIEERRVLVENLEEEEMEDPEEEVRAENPAEEEHAEKHEGEEHAENTEEFNTDQLSDRQLLVSIYGMLRGLTKDVKYVKATLKSLPQSLIRDDGAPCLSFEEEFPFLPAKAAEDIDSLNQRLLTETPFRNQMFKALKGIGGKNAGDTIRNMLAKVFSNAVLTEYSYLGQGENNRPFQNLKIVQMAHSVTKKKYPTFDTEEVKFVLSNWLRNTPKRLATERRHLNNVLEDSQNELEELPNDLPANQ